MYDLDELERLEGEATGAEWWNESSVIHAKSALWEEDNHRCIHPASCEFYEDAEFICAIRNAVPEMIAELRRLRAMEAYYDGWARYTAKPE